jgi:hypothetical protein
MRNIHSNECGNKNARQTALEKIVENIGWENFTTEDSKQKIKSLRATYQQEFNKIEKSKRSGASFLSQFPLQDTFLIILLHFFGPLCNLDSYLKLNLLVVWRYLLVHDIKASCLFTCLASVLATCKPAFHAYIILPSAHLPWNYYQPTAGPAKGSIGKKVEEYHLLGITPCRPLRDYRRFRETHRPHLCENLKSYMVGRLTTIALIILLDPQHRNDYFCSPGVHNNGRIIRNRVVWNLCMLLLLLWFQWF